MTRKSSIPLYLLCAVGFWVDFAIMLGVVALPFLILDHVKGGNTSLSGKVFATQMLVYSIACVIASKFVRHSKSILTWARWGVFLFLLSYSLFPFLPYKSVIITCSIVSFVGMAMTWPAFYAWVGSEPNESNRKKFLALFNLSWSLGFTVSPLVSGPLYDYDYRFPFILIFIINLLSLALLFLIPHEKQYFSASDARMPNEKTEVNEEVLNELYLLPYWIGVFLGNLMVIIPRSTYAEHMKQMVLNGELRFLFESNPSPILLDNPATKFSWPASFMALGTGVMFILLAWTNYWKHRISVLILSQMFCAIAFYILSYSKSLILISLCFTIIGLNHGLAFFAGTYYSVHNPLLRHSRASINEGLVGLGGVVGSLLFGYLVETFGVSFSYKWVISIIIFGILLELAVFNWKKSKIRIGNREKQLHIHLTPEK